MADYATLWACQDCTMFLVNAEAPPEMSEEEYNEWRARMDSELGPYRHVTPGLLAAECEFYHECDSACARDLAEEIHDGYGRCIQRHDCSEHDGQCERIEFTRSSCDTCGSRLGGNRHAFTGWIEGLS